MNNKEQESYLIKPPILLSLLTVIYVVGVYGLSIPVTRPYFVFMVPLNILMTVILLMLYHRPYSLRFGLVLLGIGIAGFTAEFIGIKTGLIFGNYHYEGGLGVKVLDVPLILIPNWAYMIYITANLASSISKRFYIKVLLGAFFMVAYDLLLEPSAIEFNFWEWENGYVPLHNYFGWLGLSLMFHWVYQRLSQPAVNPISTGVLVIQTVFFMSLFVINMIKSM